MGFLAGKRALIVGVASERSIAWGIAQAMAREGASLAFTYQTERLGERVRDMAAETGSTLCLPLDVASDDEIKRMYETLGASWNSVDAIVTSQIQVEQCFSVTWRCLLASRLFVHNTQPANPDFQPIIVKDCRIQGIVRSVLRKY